MKTEAARKEKSDIENRGNEQGENRANDPACRKKRSRKNPTSRGAPCGRGCACECVLETQARRHGSTQATEPSARRKWRSRSDATSSSAAVTAQRSGRPPALSPLPSVGKGSGEGERGRRPNNMLLVLPSDDTPGGGTITTAGVLIRAGNKDAGTVAAVKGVHSGGTVMRGGSCDRDNLGGSRSPPAAVLVRTCDADTMPGRGGTVHAGASPALESLPGVGAGASKVPAPAVVVVGARVTSSNTQSQMLSGVPNKRAVACRVSMCSSAPSSRTTHKLPPSETGCTVGHSPSGTTKTPTKENHGAIPGHGHTHATNRQTQRVRHRETYQQRHHGGSTGAARPRNGRGHGLGRKAQVPRPDVAVPSARVQQGGMVCAHGYMPGKEPRENKRNTLNRRGPPEGKQAEPRRDAYGGEIARPGRLGPASNWASSTRPMPGWWRATDRRQTPGLGYYMRWQAGRGWWLERPRVVRARRCPFASPHDKNTR